MAIVKVVNDKFMYHPVESCTEDLLKLLKNISERQKIMYRVPYFEINQIMIELDPSPDEDVAKFNEKYSFVQSQQNRITSILIELRNELKIWRGFRDELKIYYKKARNFALSEKPEIKALRNKELQEAAIQSEVSDLVDLVDGVDNIINSLEEDLDIVKLKKENLDTVNVNLSRQQKVVEDIMALNGIVGVRGAKVKLNINR